MNGPRSQGVSDQNFRELPEDSSLQDFVAKLMLKGRVGLMGREPPRLPTRDVCGM